MKKVLVIILLILMMPLVLYGCPRVLRISGMVHESLQKQQIFRFVYENEDELTAVAEGQIAGTNQDKRFGKAEIEGVYDGKQPIVQFYWDGIGIAPSSAYFGFYYAPEDKPALMDNVDGIFYPKDADTWEFSDGFGNSGTTIRIVPHWFYYKMWF